MSSLLKVSNLQKNYQSFQLKHVNFELPEGTVMGLIGQNGAGKSTTIKLILDMISKDGGEIEMFGQDHQNDALRQDIGVVFDENNFPDTINAAQVSKIMRNIYTNWNEKTFFGYISRFQIPLKKNIKDYSRGMKMKLSIAAAMSHEARLLVMDEPTSGLDPIVRNEILDIFRDYIMDGEKSILLSSHITTDLEKIADYITFIHNGEIQESGSKDELLYQYAIVKGTKSDLLNINAEDLIGVQKSAFGFEALVKNKQQIARKYPNLVLDHASLEDIMLFFVRGEK